MSNSIINLCAGYGGVETGISALSEAFQLYSVETDPTSRKQTQGAIEHHQRNFPSHKFIKSTIQEVAANRFEDLPRNPLLLWCSPPCTNFSMAKKQRMEATTDLQIAEAIQAGLTQLLPEFFVLENVCQYTNSRSFEKIIETLRSLVYGYQIKEINFKDYGLPQSRRRLVLVAAKNTDSLQIPFPLPFEASVSWYETIKPLIPTFTQTNLTITQKRNLAQYKVPTDQPVLIFRVSSGRFKYRLASEKHIHTLTKSMFSDQRENSRKPLDLLTPDGTYSLSIQACARLAGFPDWVQWSGMNSLDGTGIGRAVPPSFVTLLLKCLFDNRN